MSTSFFDIESHVISTQYVREYPAATAEDQEDELQLCVKQYTPLRTNPSIRHPITIIGAHANAFPKELYEPLWDDLLNQLETSGVAIKSIYIADVAHQASSGILNEDKLGNDPSWLDHSRDMLHMINHFRKDMTRPLIGVGHSMQAISI